MSVYEQFPQFRTMSPRQIEGCLRRQERTLQAEVGMIAQRTSKLGSWVDEASKRGYRNPLNGDITYALRLCLGC